MQQQRKDTVGILFLLLSIPTLLLAQSNSAHPAPGLRARDIGIPFDGVTGPFNAITDVKGVEVGYKTLISGDGKLVVGKGPVRNRRHGDSAAWQGKQAECVRGLLFRKWQRRHDGDALD